MDYPFSELNDFLAAFYPEPDETIHIRALAAKGDEDYARNLVVSRHRLLNAPELRRELLKLNEKQGLYFCPNAGGATDSEITRYNAFFCESDTNTIQEQRSLLDAFPLQPSMRVETLRSVHAYWLIEGYCSEQEWRDMQQRLIDYFDGDKSIKNPSRVMRLPYFDHVSYDTQKENYSFKHVTVVECDRALRYTTGQMQGAFPSASELAADTDTDNTSKPDLTTWDALNAEARRRIRRLKPQTIANDGIWLHTKGPCHDGYGNKALFLNLDTGAYGCMNECDTATILKSLGLPTQPSVINDSSKSLVCSWREFSK